MFSCVVACSCSCSCPVGARDRICVPVPTHPIPVPAHPVSVPAHPEQDFFVVARFPQIVQCFRETVEMRGVKGHFAACQETFGFI